MRAPLSPHDEPLVIPVATEMDITLVRQAVRQHATRLGFSLVDMTKLVTASSELARNAVKYGGGGSATLQVVRQGGRNGLTVTFEDSGPGILDVDAALRDGFTSGNGMGLGLGGARRLVNDFQLHTMVGVGTRVVVTRWL